MDLTMQTTVLSMRHCKIEHLILPGWIHSVVCIRGIKFRENENLRFALKNRPHIYDTIGD